MSRIVSFIFISCLPFFAFSQMGIGTTSPHPKAELHVSSADQGVLIPRMDSTSMKNIPSPVDGLLIYNTDEKRFFYRNQGAWEPCNFRYRQIVSDADGDTRVEVEKTDDEDVIHFSADADADGTKSAGAGDEVLTISASAINLLSESDVYKIENTQVLRKNGSNIFVGTGGASVTGNSNVGFGYGALDNLVAGSGNVAIGHDAGKNVGSANNSVFVGENTASSGASLLSGSGNVAIGHNAGALLEGAAEYNTIIGAGSGTALTTGSNNIIVGANSGNDIVSSDSNIVIGNDISVADPGANGQLNIAGVISSDSIYNSNGNVIFAGAYSFPDTTGDADMTLVMNDANQLYWSEKTVVGEAALTVTGAATNMQPWNRVLADPTTHDAYRLLFVPVTAMANGFITKISVFIVSCSADTDLHLGLYTAAGAITDSTDGGDVRKLRASMPILSGTNGMITLDFLNEGLWPVRVEAGVKYYIAVYDPNNRCRFLENTDPDVQMRKASGVEPTPLQDNYAISSMTKDGDVIWVRAH